MKKGFTLLEIIVVIIIIGVLATLGFTQYTKVIEKGRTAEAKTILGQLRGAQIVYYQEHGEYTTTLNSLYVGSLPVTGACATRFYFGYECADTGSCTATRCTAAGKEPQGPDAYVINLSVAGVFSGSAGYF